MCFGHCGFLRKQPHAADESKKRWGSGKHMAHYNSIFDYICNLHIYIYSALSCWALSGSTSRGNRKVSCLSYTVCAMEHRDLNCLSFHDKQLDSTRKRLPIQTWTWRTLGFAAASAEESSPPHAKQWLSTTDPQHLQPSARSECQLLGCEHLRPQWVGGSWVSWKCCGRYSPQ